MAWDTPVIQVDVNTRGRTDNEFYDHVNANVHSCSAALDQSGNYDGKTFGGVMGNACEIPLAALGLQGITAAPYTVAGRFRTAAVDLVESGTLTCLHKGAVGDRFGNLTTSGNQCSVAHAGAGVNQFAQGGGPLAESVEYVFAMRVMPGMLRVEAWMNGVRVGEAEGVDPVDSFPDLTHLKLGARTTNWPLNGTLMWAAVWDESLSDGDMAELAARENPFVEPSAPGITGVSPSKPAYGEASVIVSGSGFGAAQGTIRYNGHPLSVVSWSDTSIEARWVQVGEGMTVLPDLDYALVVNALDPFLVQTAIPTGVQYGTVLPNDLGVAGIFDNDVVTPNVDSYYGSPVVDDGQWDYTNMAEGVIDSVPNGGVFRYALFDGTLGRWTRSVDETFTVT